MSPLEQLMNLKYGEVQFGSYYHFKYRYKSETGKKVMQLTELKRYPEIKVHVTKKGYYLFYGIINQYNKHVLDKIKAVAKLKPKPPCMT